MPERAATLIFNDGVAGTDGREAPIPTTAPTTNDIPAMMISNDIGEALYNARATATVRIVVDATTTPNEEMNVIADSPRGNKDRTIVVGAHLDSVEAGPGINDNGSGSSGDPRDRRADREARRHAAQPAPLRLLGRRGVRARGLDGLRRGADGERQGRPDRSEPQLRHDRLAELRALRVRRRPVRLTAAAERRAGGLGPDRAAVQPLLRSSGPGLRADRVRWTLRLRAVHHEPDPGRRAVHGRRGAQDAPRRKRCSVESQGCLSTPATTRHATRSST